MEPGGNSAEIGKEASKTQADIVYGLGGLERTTPPEALMVDKETVDCVLRFAKGVEVDDDALALDVIDKARLGGRFMGEKHTLKHFKERWMPRMDVDSLGM